MKSAPEPRSLLPAPAGGRALVRIGVALYVVYATLMVALPSRGLLQYSFADDALYYLEIGRRFGQAPWPTFDGRHVTTGFHPLWLAIVVVIERCLPDDPWLVLRVVKFVSAMLLLGAIIALGRLVARLSGAMAGALTIALLAGSATLAQIGLMGMESPLAALFFVLLLSELFGGLRRPVAIGLLAGLAILARLDTCLFVAAAFLAWLWQTRRLAPPIAASAIAFAVVSPFFVLLYALTGHFSTTSAAVKELVVQMDAQRQYGGRLSLGYVRWGLGAMVKDAYYAARTLFGGVAQAGAAIWRGQHPLPGETGTLMLLVPLSFGVAVLLGWAIARRGPWRSAPRRVAALSLLVAAMGGGAAAQLSAASLILPGQAGWWYWVLGVMAIAVALVWIQQRHARTAAVIAGLAWANVIAMAVLAASVVAGYASGGFDARPLQITSMARFADEIRERVPPGEQVGSCNAGAVGFFSDQGIVNLDGLVNSWSYKEAREHDRVRGWMREDGIKWFVDCIPRVQVPEYMKNLGLTPEDVEVVETQATVGCEAQLWRIRWSPDATASASHPR